MKTPTDLIDYAEARRLTGLPRRTLIDRIDREGITTYVPGHDRRRRLLRRADVDRLIGIEVIERRPGSPAADLRTAEEAVAGLPETA